jgi:hypothetical protein
LLSHLLAATRRPYDARRFAMHLLQLVPRCSDGPE